MSTDTPTLGRPTDHPGYVRAMRLGRALDHRGISPTEAVRVAGLKTTDVPQLWRAINGHTPARRVVDAVADAFDINLD